MPLKKWSDYNNLPCLFCGKLLDGVEALRCEWKKINVVTRYGADWAVCTLCLKQALLIESRLYATVWVKPSLTGDDEKDLVIRCHICGGILSDSEKDRHFVHKEPYIYRRGHLRGRCYDCSSDGLRATN
uniref:Protein E6 n=1 Tax=Camelus dromedarius papillomavirus 1 TaxID=996650 RepID=A0A7D7QNK9_9PAPI|nr:early protein E6 [Camelus dromedarius papillomavirus 1]